MPFSTHSEGVQPSEAPKANHRPHSHCPEGLPLHRPRRCRKRVSRSNQEKPEKSPQLLPLEQSVEVKCAFETWLFTPLTVLCPTRCSWIILLFPLDKAHPVFSSSPIGFSEKASETSLLDAVAPKTAPDTPAWILLYQQLCPYLTDLSGAPGQTSLASQFPQVCAVPDPGHCTTYFWSAQITTQTSEHVHEEGSENQKVKW